MAPSEIILHIDLFLPSSECQLQAVGARSVPSLPAATAEADKAKTGYLDAGRPPGSGLGPETSISM